MKNNEQEIFDFCHTSVENLVGVTTAGAAATGRLELAANRQDTRTRGRALGTRCTAKVFGGSARVALASQQNGVGAGRARDGELVKSDALATGGLDARAGSVGEAERRHSHLRDDASVARVVGDFGDNNRNLGVGLAGHRNRQLRDRNRHTRDASGGKALGNNLVEAGLGAARKKRVQLVQQAQIHVLRGGRSATRLANVLFDVNTLKKKRVVCELRKRKKKTCA